MKSALNIPLLFLALTVCLASTAQGDWHWNNQAYFQKDATEKALLWSHLDYNLASNSLSNGLLNEAIYQSEITPEAAARDSENFGNGRGGLGGHVESETWFRSGGAGWRWIAGIGFQEHIGARVENDLLGLYLRGNAPYEDQTLELGPSRLFYSSHQFIGLGAERSGESVTFGFTLNLLKVSRYQSVDIEEGNLYTAPFGEYIESRMNLTYETTGSKEDKLPAWSGTGVTLSTYLQWEVSEATTFYAKVKDLGMMHFGGLNTAVVDTNYRFEGAQVSNILQLDDSLFENGSLDSLEALLGLSITNESTAKLAPGYLMIGFSTSFSERVGLNVEVKQWWKSAALPQLRLGLPLRISPRLTLEPSLRIGGWNLANSGLTVAFAPFEKLMIVLRTEQFENLLVSDNASGQSLTAGAWLRF